MRVTKAVVNELIRLKQWTALIKLLPEGMTTITEKMDYQTYMRLRATCCRERRYGDQLYWISSRYDKGSVTIEKHLKDEESGKQRLQAE